MTRAVLGLELSGRRCTAALRIGGREQQIDFSESRGRAAMSSIATLMEQEGIERTDLAMLLVGVGPGSYTGLRIACSLATSLASALPLEAHGISSFAAAAFARQPQEDLHLLLDGYRNEAYHACYRLAEGRLQVLQDAQVLSREQAIQQVGPGQAFLGHADFAHPEARHLGALEVDALDLLRYAASEGMCVDESDAVSSGMKADGSGFQAALPPVPLYLRPAAYRPGS